MTGISSRYVMVDGIKTHFVESGSGHPLVLLHGGEFGGCAELSWERNIEVLSRHYRVFAPDWVGYGRTDKIFSFDDMWGYRIRHITAFLRAVCVDRAHFAGNSMGGTLLLAVAAMQTPVWPLDKIIVIAGGGEVPENEARAVLNGFDGTRASMKRIVQVMFATPTVRNDEAYIERRWKLAREHGAWECAAAMRFKAPWRESQRMPHAPDYSSIRCPVLLVSGSADRLRPPGFGPKLQAQIPAAELRVLDGVGHCPQIEAAEEFNRLALAFLGGGAAIAQPERERLRRH
jgi:2-hydroxymuconate-semialdehyde hydrolase